MSEVGRGRRERERESEAEEERSSRLQSLYLCRFPLTRSPPPPPHPPHPDDAGRRQIREEAEALLPSTPPAHVRAIFGNGFRNPFGAVALAGLFGLPFSAYLSLSLSESTPAELGAMAQPVGLLFAALATPTAVTALALARLFAASAEAWVLGRHVSRLVLEDALLRGANEESDDRQRGE